MRLTYQRGGNVAKSKFDYSLLTPINQQKNSFESQLKPIDSQEDAGAYLDSLPDEQGFLSKLPRNIIAGLAGLGHSTINFPYETVKSLEDMGANNKSQNGISKNDMRELSELRDTSFSSPGFKASEYIPHQQDYNFPQLLGQKGEGTLMDNLIQKGIEYSPEILGATKLISHGLRKFPVTQKMASRRLREAENIMNQFMAPRTPISEELIEQSRAFLPKTHATKEMLEAARAGRYSPSFSLQSQIGKHERDLRKSPLAAERLLAPQARELKKTILSEMESSLRSQGHDDIADMLKGGIDDYRKYIKFRDTALPVMKKIGIPTSLLTLLGIGFKKGKDVASGLVE